ncbi:MAG: hypothetical protein HUU46_03945 [Candidatus Hydrogenedentes bacterium]|nr:hypothetical protein [Candidatus Hydrogenedentota bacterium]
MIQQIRAKQERVIEAVRRGLEGLAAVEFIQQSGYAMTPAGIVKHLRAMGGRGHIQDLIHEGMSNFEILQGCFPEDDLSHMKPVPPSQEELFAHGGSSSLHPIAPHPTNIYELRKMAIKVPADLYEAIRLASKAEGKSQNDLIVDVLTTALSRVPLHGGEEHPASDYD